MSLLRRLWAEILVMICMMVGITPPAWAREKTASKTEENR